MLIATIDAFRQSTVLGEDTQHFTLDLAPQLAQLQGEVSQLRARARAGALRSEDAFERNALQLLDNRLATAAQQLRLLEETTFAFAAQVQDTLRELQTIEAEHARLNAPPDPAPVDPTLTPIAEEAPVPAE